MNCARRASADMLAVAKVAARARIHGCDKHEVGGIARMAPKTTELDIVAFQWLAEGFQAIAGELREFVEMQDAEMG